MAGTQGAAWSSLALEGEKLGKLLREYFDDAPNPNLSSKFLPYIAGIMLDDLAQPPCYGAETRRLVLREVMKHIHRAQISPADNRVQFKFPETYEKLIQLARFSNQSQVSEQAASLVNRLVKEIHETSYLN